jgi:hypothetical protein
LNAITKLCFTLDESGQLPQMERLQDLRIDGWHPNEYELLGDIPHFPKLCKLQLFCVPISDERLKGFSHVPIVRLFGLNIRTVKCFDRCAFLHLDSCNIESYEGLRGVGKLWIENENDLTKFRDLERPLKRDPILRWENRTVDGELIDERNWYLAVYENGEQLFNSEDDFVCHLIENLREKTRFFSTINARHRKNCPIKREAIDALWRRFYDRESTLDVRLRERRRNFWSYVQKLGLLENYTQSSCNC